MSGSKAKHMASRISGFAREELMSWCGSNQVRLWFSSVAYVLLNELRRLGLAGTDLAQARCDTIRTKLLKIGAQVKVTVRRVWVQLASSYPHAALFAHIVGQLRASRPALA